MQQYRVDPEFRDYLPKLDAEERAELAGKIEREGVLPGSIVVGDVSGDFILLDGHHTLEICEEKGLAPPAPVMRSFATRGEALQWVEDNQLARRNLTDKEKRRKARIERVAKARGEGQSTRAIAEAEGVSQTQVCRDLKESTEPGEGS